MAAYYLDSSAIVKRYLKETGSSWVVQIAQPGAGNPIHVARITGVEVISALVRNGRSGNVAPGVVVTALADFRQDFTGSYQIVELALPVFSRAMTLAEVHGLRGYDAVQLAAALELNSQRANMGMPALIFVSADTALNAAAAAEGFAVDDPNTHP